jgi:hypothetical protein
MLRRRTGQAGFASARCADKLEAGAEPDASADVVLDPLFV